MNWKVIVLCLAVGATIGGWWQWHQSAPAPSTVSSSMITAISAPELVTMVRGENSPLVLVNFWASWCAPCKAEFPALLSIREKWAARGLKMIFVSIDEPSDLAAAEEFLQQVGVQFPTYFKGTQPLTFLKEIYPAWQGSVPTSLLFAPEGKLVDGWEGDSTPAELEARVAKQLKGS